MYIGFTVRDSALGPCALTLGDIDIDCIEIEI